MLTDNIDKAKKFIDAIQAYGGGDLPEAICCGLEKSLNEITWRNDSVKIAILISDAPPHGFELGSDGFPNRCPLKNDPVAIAFKIAEKEIALYCAGCEPSVIPYKIFFHALTLITGGKYISLGNHKELANIIIDGAHEEVRVFI